MRSVFHAKLVGYTLVLFYLGGEEILPTASSTGIEEIINEGPCYSHSDCTGDDIYCDVHNACWSPCSDCQRHNDAIDGNCPPCAGQSTEDECSLHSDCSGDTYCDEFHNCFGPCDSCERHRDAIDGICPTCDGRVEEETDYSTGGCSSHSDCNGDSYCDTNNNCFAPCDSCERFHDAIDGICPPCTEQYEEEIQFTESPTSPSIIDSPTDTPTLLSTGEPTEEPTRLVVTSPPSVPSPPSSPTPRVERICFPPNINSSCCDDILCGLGEGDCDKDSHCQEGLICDKGNSCKQFHDDFPEPFDCCVKPRVQSNDQRQGICGDGIVTRPEECDDGNSNDSDGCRSDCTVPYCGDGIQDANEECDTGYNEEYIVGVISDTKSCTADCHLIGETGEINNMCDPDNRYSRGNARKYNPGFCGCNNADVDKDRDGFMDCSPYDLCPTNPVLQAEPCDELCGTCAETRNSPGCSNVATEACVCLIDPFCCTGHWDVTCVALALAHCECIL